MATVSTPEVLLTAEQFGERPDPGYPEELVRGRIVTMPPARFRHGRICTRVGRIFDEYAESRRLGVVVNNDTGVITERSPDTVRGADVAFYSFKTLPEDVRPEKYAETPPELVVEVRSPSDRWPRILQKVAEYLEVGVLAVVVLDEDRLSAHVFETDAPVLFLGPDDELTLLQILPGFTVAVRRFFE